MLKFFTRQILLPVFIIVFILYYFLATTAGLKTVIWLGQKGIGADFSAEKIEGNLANTIILQKLEFNQSNRQPKFHMEAERLQFQINLLAIFKKTIELSNVQLEQAIINFHALPDEPLHVESLTGDFASAMTGHTMNIKMNQITGQFKHNPLHGKGHLLIQNKQLKDIETSLYLGQNQIQIKKALESFEALPKTVSPQFQWAIDAKLDPEFGLKTTGVFNINEEPFNVKGTVKEMEITSAYLDTWQMSNSSDFIINENQLILEPLWFNTNAQTHLLMVLNWDKIKGGKLRVSIPEFVYHLPQTKGKVSVDLTVVKTPTEALNGQLEVKIFPGKANLKLPGNRYYNTTYQGGLLKANWQKGALEASLDFTETFRNHLNLAIFVPRFSLDTPLDKQDIQGNFKGQIQDVNIVYLLAPAISRLKANIDFFGDIAGTIEKPTLKLHANVREGIFSIQKQHIIIRDFSTNVDGDIPGQLQFTTRGTLGYQPFTIKGVMNPFAELEQGSFTITGENLRVSNTSNVFILASPTLQGNIIDNNLYVTGEVLITEANIQLKDETAQVVTSNDIVFFDKRAQEEDIIENFTLVPDITLKMSKEDKVHFKGYGLDAILRGDVRIEQRPDGSYVGIGRLAIKEGKYRLQGSHYHIRRGYLLYPPGTLINDPKLDIRITKKKMETDFNSEVGIYVEGNLKKPKYQLYSSDNLENTEILSRLGFGGSQVEGENNQKKLLSQSVMFLAGGANSFIEALQKKLGLEEFGLQSAESQRIISSNAGQDTVLVVGRSLSKHFYLQFIQGMLEPISLIRLKYQFNPNFAVSVDTSTAEDIGADIIFSKDVQ